MRGDERDFQALYVSHYAAVFGYCLRRSHRDDAADLAAEVFVVAWRRRSDLPDDEFVLPWLYTVAANVLSNHRRGKRRRAGLIDKARRLISDPMPDVADEVIRRDRDSAAIDAVNRLRPRDREIILLSAWEGLSARQIAIRFDLSVAAAEKRLSRAKHRLATELAGTDKRRSVTERGMAL